jgi:sugar O-acyltransferase (sialic acid O-acetyltransferase NeuD family)
MKLYAVVGTGGFGREVMPLAVAMLQATLPVDSYSIVFVDEHKNNLVTVNNHLALSIEEFIAHPAQEKYFNVAIADCRVRKRLAEKLLAEGALPFTIYAQNHVILQNNEIDMGAIFCDYSTVTSNAKIGKFFHANIYSYVAHDCIIGDFVTFAPNAHCNGNVIIEDYAYIGAGALIRQGKPGKPMIIGKGAIVGMGAVVTKHVAPFTTVAGNPARLLSKAPIQQSCKTEEI